MTSESKQILGEMCHGVTVTATVSVRNPLFSRSGAIPGELKPFSVPAISQCESHRHGADEEETDIKRLPFMQENILCIKCALVVED